MILQFIISGVTLGSIYTLIALGFNIIYKSTDIINFAQGEFVMLGGMWSIFFHQKLHLPLVLSFFFSVLIVTIIGILMERLTIYPARNQNKLVVIIITIGVSILLQGTAMFIWDKDTFALSPFSGDKPIEIFGSVIIPQQIWIISITFVVVFLLYLFYNKTVLGKAMTACSLNKKGALLSGIDADFMVLVSFALAAMLGAIAGTIIAPITMMSYDKGTMLGLKGFSAAIFGGIGSFSGVIIGGLLIGLIETFTAGYISSHFRDAIVFILMILVLFVQPDGLMGINRRKG